jgi:hypothetical protein
MSAPPVVRCQLGRSAHALFVFVACSVSLSCGQKPQLTAPGQKGGVPVGQLPTGVQPIGYQLELSIVPGQ